MKKSRDGLFQHPVMSRLGRSIIRFLSPVLVVRKKPLFALVALLTVFAIPEILSRLAGVPQERTYFLADDGMMHWQDPELFWTPRGGFAEKFRAARATGPSPLIYCFGGSVVQGFHAEHPFSQVIEEFLRNESGMKNAVVINWGADGYTSYQSRVLAGRAVAARSPDLIIACNAWNDHEVQAMSDVELAERNRGLAKRLLFLLNHSRAFGFTRRKLLAARRTRNKGRSAQTPHSRRVPLKDYRRQLALFRSLAREADSDLIFLTQASPYLSLREDLAPYHRAMREASARHPSVRFVDVRPAMEKALTDEWGFAAPAEEVGLETSYFFDLCHPTDRGHRLIAEELFPTVREIIRGRLFD